MLCKTSLYMRALKFNLFCLGLVCLSACGNKTTSQDVRGVSAPDDKQLVGSLGDALKELQASRFQSDCDRKLNPIKKALVLQVIQQASNLTSPPSPTQDTRPIVPFAGSYLLNYPKPSPSPGSWSHYRYGWKEVNDTYEQNKDHPTPKLWNYLNSMVRSLTTEDQRRVIYGLNDSIDHVNVQALPEILKTVNTCKADTTCAVPPFSDAIIPLVKSVEFYRYYMEAILEEPEFTKKRDTITRFAKRVAEDAEFRLENFNSELKLTRDGSVAHIELGLDATHFTSDEQSLIQKIIETIWTSPEADVKVKIESKTDFPKLFEVLFHLDRPGQRAYVSYEDNTLNLFPGTRTRSIAHEFGHVIGLSDHYYTVWDEAKCEYDQESNSLDLMSDSESGDVTPEDWKTILDHLSGPQS